MFSNCETTEQVTNELKKYTRRKKLQTAVLMIIVLSLALTFYATIQILWILIFVAVSLYLQLGAKLKSYEYLAQLRISEITKGEI